MKKFLFAAIIAAFTLMAVAFTVCAGYESWAG
jgi:hypothetical protein